MADAISSPAPEGATGVLVLADGTIVWGKGFGAEGDAVGEVCFNTAMTGYQEIMTDPSYASQIVTFTFPHIGNVGANHEDIEADNPFTAAEGDGLQNSLGVAARDEIVARARPRRNEELLERTYPSSNAADDAQNQ